MEQLLEHPIQLRIFFFEQVRRLEEIFRQHRKKFMFVCVRVIANVRNDFWKDGRVPAQRIAPNA